MFLINRKIKKKSSFGLNFIAFLDLLFSLFFRKYKKKSICLYVFIQPFFF